eukprot:Skav201470  [mRNA]  locus=scaffold663:87954:93619:+ [translate_table: standard]
MPNSQKKSCKEEPEQIATTIAEWLSDPDGLETMSDNARQLAKPEAALQIARRICDGLLDLGVELKEAPAQRKLQSFCVKASDFQLSQRDKLLQRKAVPAVCPAVRIRCVW